MSIPMRRVHLLSCQPWHMPQYYRILSGTLPSVYWLGVAELLSGAKYWTSQANLLSAGRVRQDRSP